MIDSSHIADHSILYDIEQELEEELNVKPLNNDFIETKLYNGRDENNKLYDARGEVTTSGFIFEISPTKSIVFE